MAVRKNPAPNSSKKVRRKKKPLIRRIRFDRLILLLVLVSGIAYGVYVAASEVYNFASLKYAQYREEHPSKPIKPPIAPQIVDKRFENYINILLIGIDDQPVEGIGEAGRYADALMLVSMNRETGQVRFLALPRNIRTAIPGRKDEDYLSFTYYYGGSPLAVNTVSQLLNIPITQYIAIDRKALSKFIDTIGGVNLYVERDMNYDDPVSGTSIHLKRGYQRLTGDMSQQYLRFRNDDLGDIGRVHRQQKFAEALFEKLISIEILPALPTIITIFNDNMDTNIDITDISSIIDIINTLYTNKIEIQILPGNLGGLGEWIPDKARVQQMIDDMFPPVEAEAEK